jgi:formate-dependent nitrite reductase membrane component NrfD
MRTEQFQPARNGRFLKPQEEWKGIIAIYLYLAGMGAGSFIIGVLLHWLGISSSPRIIPSIKIFGLPMDFAKVPILWGPILVAMGAPFLILDLGIKRRFMYACLNPKTSWVARGFLILSTFILLGLILLAKSVLPFEWLHKDSSLWLIPEAMALLFAFGTAIYTGVLLKATRSVPLWNTYLLPLLFLVSALSTGSMAIILSTLGTGFFSHDTGALRALASAEQVLVVIEGIVLYLYLFRTYRSTDQGKDSVRLLVSGEKRPVFWGGIVLMGFIFPIVLENVASFFHGNVPLLFVAGLVLLCGGFFLRLGVLSAGIKERIPMQRWIQFQQDMRAVR